MAGDQTLSPVLDHLNVGVLLIDAEGTVEYCNRFIEAHSQRSAAELVGGQLFELFPEIDRKWFARQCKTAQVLGQPAFSSWKQRPHVFEFVNRQAVTASIPTMRQDCTFLPMEGNRVCVLVSDVTETSVYQSQLEGALQTVEELSIRDGLTGVFNRRHIEKRLGSEFARHRRYGTDLSVAMVDLDHFKSVNDTYGHLVGDEVLRTVAKTLMQLLRATDAIGRFGGEEFIVVLPAIDADQAMLASERLREAVAGLSIETDREPLRVSASIGVATTTSDHADHVALVRDADKGLYRAKERGRNRVVRWEGRS